MSHVNVHAELIKAQNTSRHAGGDQLLLFDVITADMAHILYVRTSLGPLVL